MGGARRHHYVPDFLLRRFAVRGAGRDATVRGLVRGRVCEVNTKKVGVVNLFHRCAGLADGAETVLSGYEGELAEETAAWNPGPLDRDGAEAARDLVRHLRVRSPRVRALLNHVADGVGAVMERCVREAFPDMPPPRSVREEMLGLYDPATMPVGNPAALWKELASTVPAVLGGHVRYALLSAFREFVTSTRLLDIVGQAHTMVVIRDLYQAAETDALHRLEWEVVEEPSGGLLLGEGAPVARYRGSDAFFELFQREQPLELVAMPIAPGRLLVGRSPGRELPSADAINAAMVGLSEEFVIGRRPKEVFEGWRERFGAAVDRTLMARVSSSEAEPMRREILSALRELSGQLDRFLERAMGVPTVDLSRHVPAVTVVPPRRPMARSPGSSGPQG